MNGHVRQRSLMIVLAVALLIAALRFGWLLLGFEGIPVASGRPALGVEEDGSTLRPGASV